MHRSSGQMDFSDSWLDPGLGRNGRLERIHAVLDWSLIEQLVGELHSAAEGRRAYPPLIMVKILLLQQWYGMSDPRAEEALSDSLAFRRFVGLGMADGTPDHSTISRFRLLLGEAGLDAALFAQVCGQLEQRGLILKQGTLLDATLVQAQARKPPYGKDKGSPGEVAEDKAGGGKGTVDPDADWTVKNRKSHYGYKAHVAVDAGSGLIRRAILTPAKTSESEVADRLVCGDEAAIYADKAYEHKERRARLKAAGIKDRILHRSHKNQAGLPYWQRRRNALISPIRAGVERIFGTLKRCYGYTKVRYYDLAANTTQLNLLATAYNLRRAATLLA